MNPDAIAPQAYKDWKQWTENARYCAEFARFFDNECPGVEPLPDHMDTAFRHCANPPNENTAPWTYPIIAEMVQLIRT